MSFILYQFSHQIRMLQPNDYLFILGFLAIVLLISVWSAHRINRKRIFLINTPRSKIRSAAQGYVEISGTGHDLPGTTPLTSPLTHKPCIWYQFAIHELRENLNSTNWAEVKRGSSSKLFLLQGETGEVIVDPQGCQPSMQGKSTNIWHAKSDDDLRKLIGHGFYFNFTPFKRYRLTETIVANSEKILALGFFRTVNRENNLTWRQEDNSNNPEHQADIANWQAYTEWHREHSPDERINILHRPQQKSRSFILSNFKENILVRRLAWRLAGSVFASIFMLSLIGFCLTVRPLL